MIDTKNILAYTALLTLIPNLHGIGDDVGINAATKISEKLQPAAENLGVEAAKLTGAAAVDSSEILGSALEKSSTTLSSGMVGTAHKLVPVATALVGIYGTVQLYTIGKDIYDHKYPSPVQEANNSEARERTEFFNSKKALRSCLMTVRMEAVVEAHAYHYVSRI